MAEAGIDFEEQEGDEGSQELYRQRRMGSKRRGCPAVRCGEAFECGDVSVFVSPGVASPGAANGEDWMELGP
jgi:hypothetical protein